MSEDHLYPAFSRSETTVLGFPGIDRDREMENALDAYWRREIDEVELAARARALGFRPDEHAADRSEADLATVAAPGPLRVAISADKDVVRVALTGPLDIYTVPAFRQDVDPSADAGGQIVIDLTGVTLIDSAGLGALVSLRNQAFRDGAGSLGLVCPQQHLRRVFELAGLRRAFSFGPDGSVVASGSGNGGEAAPNPSRAARREDMSAQDRSGGRDAMPQPSEVEGMEMRDASGAPVGRVTDVYVEHEGGAARYVAVECDEPGQVHLVPVGVVKELEGVLVAAVKAEHVRGGPTVAEAEPVHLSHEATVGGYYADLHEAGHMQPWALPPDLHAAGYMRPGNEPPELHGAGYMHPGNEPVQIHGAGYMRPGTEPPEVHGAGYMRPESEPPEVGGAGRMDPRALSAVKRWRE
jgi:anti-anti-sigma factor